MPEVVKSSQVVKRRHHANAYSSNCFIENCCKLSPYGFIIAKQDILLHKNEETYYTTKKKLGKTRSESVLENNKI